MSIKKRVEFTTLREDWTVCRLESGSILKLKTPISLIKPFEGERPGTAVESAILTVIDPVEEDRGTPSESEVIEEGDKIGEVKFTSIKEPVNIYETAGKTLLLTRPKITRVTKSNKFNKKGARLYSVDFYLPLSAIPSKQWEPPAQPQQTDLNVETEGSTS